MTLILQIADIHFGAEDPMALDAALELSERATPDIIAVCGDLTQRGKRSEFEAARAWLDQLSAPIIVAPGNHDTPLLDLWARVNEPFDRYDALFADQSRPMTAGGQVIAGLNTARGWQARRNWAEGVVELGALESVLTEEDPGPPDVLMCHHPFLSPPESPLSVSTIRGAQACQRLARSSVDLLLTGHVHAPSATVRRHGEAGYLALSAGTLSTRLRKSPPSVNVIRMEPDVIEATTWSCEGGLLSPRHLGAWSRETLEPLPGSFVS